MGMPARLAASIEVSSRDQSRLDVTRSPSSANFPSAGLLIAVTTKDDDRRSRATQSMELTDQARRERAEDARAVPIALHQAGTCVCSAPPQLKNPRIHAA